MKAVYLLLVTLGFCTTALAQNKGIQQKTVYIADYYAIREYIPILDSKQHIFTLHYSAQMNRWAGPDAAWFSVGDSRSSPGRSVFEGLFSNVNPLLNAWSKISPADKIEFFSNGIGIGGQFFEAMRVK